MDYHSIEKRVKKSIKDKIRLKRKIKNLKLHIDTLCEENQQQCTPYVEYKKEYVYVENKVNIINTFCIITLSFMCLRLMNNFGFHDLEVISYNLLMVQIMYVILYYYTMYAS